MASLLTKAVLGSVGTMGGSKAEDGCALPMISLLPINGPWGSDLISASPV